MRRIASLSLIFVVVLFLAGCGKTSLEMKTRINPDGSATRETELTTTEKKKEPVEKHYILPKGDKWEIKEEKEEVKGPKFIKPYRYQAKGTFSNVSDITPDYQRKAEFSDKVSRNYIDFKKRNYFFFTIYEYSEVFKDIATEKTFRKGIKEFFEISSKLVLDELKKRIGKDYDISKVEAIVQKKYRSLFDRLVEAIIKTGWDSTETEQAIDAFSEEVESEEIIKTITILLAAGKSAEEKKRLEEEIELALDAVEKKCEEQYSDEYIGARTEDTFGVYGFPIFTDYEFKSTITMPGKIIKTNAKKVVGNTLRWNFKPADFFIKDYVIYARSRIIHWLNIFFSVLGIVIIGGLVFFRQRVIGTIIKIKRKRKKK